MTSPAPRSPLLRTLVERGFFYQCTNLDGLDTRIEQGPITAYIGFDATADSLHVGHMMQIMMLRHLQQAGHRPIALMGGGTTKIGDPSFKDEARKMLSEEEITSNLNGIKRSFERLLKFGDGPGDAIMVNNADWLDGLVYVPFLRDIGRYFSVNRMLSMESVKLRLDREQSLSFLEFNYMILQAYDFVELSRRYDCVLQLSGSDQWGNIVNGIDLGRRVLDRELFGFTSPLITTASGAKMGKTLSGAVWLNAERLSPYEYWQFWRNTEDADVGRFLKIFTELPLDEIARLENLRDAEINEAKKILANEATALVHGADAADAAAETARHVFEEGTVGQSLPVITLDRALLSGGIPAYELLAKAGLVASNGEGRRLIKGGGAKLNDQPIASESVMIGLADLDPTGRLKLTAGKKRHVLVEPN